MSKNILKILLVFILGALGGIWAQASLLPYLAQFPIFKDIGFIRNLEEREVIINPTQTITVQENAALTQAIEKVEKTVVGVRTETAEGKFLEGAGLVVTSDGLVVTLAELVPQGSDFYFYVDGQWPSWQILKRDLKNNLALIKIGRGGLSTAGFADIDKTKIGERVFLLGAVFQSDSPNSTTSSATGQAGQATSTQKLLPTPAIFANEGMVSRLGDSSVQTNIQDFGAAGSPLFNVSGNVIGVNMVDGSGRVSTVPISIIRTFIGF